PEQSEGPPEHRNVPPPERSEGPPEHRNVPPPERSEGPQSFLYYVMPYVDGISLRDRLTHADPGAIARRIVYTAF
ncbi:MAG: hypothetical protein ACRELE_10970, partial [Gemmatimonadales bacterium]